MSTSGRLCSNSEAASRSDAANAADDEALDGEFLDYLDSLEGDREDWTWFSEKDGAKAAEPEDDATDAEAR